MLLIKCPYCRATGFTNPEPKTGTITWLWCVGICLVGGFLGCCLIPFYKDCSRDIGHYCYSCNKYLGRYDRLRKKGAKR